MATVKVKLHPSSVAGRAGALHYRVTCNRTTRHITTDIHLCPDDYNALVGMLSKTTVTIGSPSAAFPSCSIVRRRIESDMALLRSIVRELDNSGRRYSAVDVVRLYRAHGSRIGILDFIRVQIVQLQQADRFGTARGYEKTLRSFAMFLAVSICLYRP